MQVVVCARAAWRPRVPVARARARPRLSAAQLVLVLVLVVRIGAPHGAAPARAAGGAAVPAAAVLRVSRAAGSRLPPAERR